MYTADILQAWEMCRRKGVWTAQYESVRLHPTKMLALGIRAALLETERTDIAEVAGETVMRLAAERQLDTKAANLYDLAIHHACMADIIAAHLRKPGEPAWSVPEDTEIADTPWRSSALLSASGRFTRIVLVDHWTDSRHASEYHSWHTLGEVVAYQQPMTQVVIVLGASRGGKRHNPWSKGLLHPSNKKLRFRKRQNSTTTGFSNSWIPVWREEQDQIPRETWLRAMDEDGVLEEACFRVEIPLPDSFVQERIRQTATTFQTHLPQSSAYQATNYLAQISTCDFPPCQFRNCCWSQPERTPDQGGYIAIGTRAPQPQ